MNAADVIAAEFAKWRGKRPRPVTEAERCEARATIAALSASVPGRYVVYDTETGALRGLAEAGANQFVVDGNWVSDPLFTLVDPT